MPMIQTFTQNDLIRFLYHETSEEETREIERAISYDPELALQLEEFKVVARELNENQMEPSASVLQRILEHAKQARA